MLFSLSVINDKTFLSVGFCARPQKDRAILGTSTVCAIERLSRRCRGPRCRKCRGRFTVTGTSIQDDTIRKQEGTNEAERFTHR